MKSEKITAAAIYGLAAVAAAVFLTINYDVYNYHLWSYIASEYGISSLYDLDKYFLNSCDYMPFGAYIYVLPGKLFSLAVPLTVNRIPYINFYKIMPVLILIMFSFMILNSLRNCSRRDYLTLLAVSLPMLLITSLFGENDILIIAFLFLSVMLLEKNRVNEGIFFALINLTVKQTSLFWVLLILAYYMFRTDEKRRFLLITLIEGVVLFVFMFFPFIISGKIFKVLENLLFNTVHLVTPLSCSAFNAFSLIPNAQYIDFNYNIAHIPVSIYSILIMSAGVIAVSAFSKKVSIYEAAGLYGLLWYNAHVGLRSQHMIYMLVFALLYTLVYRRGMLFIIGYSIILILNIILTQSVITMPVMNMPVLSPYAMITFSAVQLALSIAFFIYIIRNAGNNTEQRTLHVPGKNSVRALIISVTVIACLAFAVPGSVDKNENEWISDIMKTGNLIDYSHESYIEPIIISRGLFRKYLGIRMSDNAYFSVNMVKYNTLEFTLETEHIGNAVLNINGETYHADDTARRFIYENTSQDTVIITSHTGSKYGILVLYDTEFR